MDGDRVALSDILGCSGDDLGCSGDRRGCPGDRLECSGDKRGGSGMARLANSEWKCAGEVAYSGAPNRGGRESGGKYCAPNKGVLAYLLGQAKDIIKLIILLKVKSFKYLN
jgi:hypothetical protein